MKPQKIFLFGLLIMSVWLLSACDLWKNEIKNESSESIKLVTTFAPVYSHTKAIVQDHAKITNLVEIGKSVHNRQLTPQKAMELENSDGIIINGIDLEEFLEDYLESIDDKIIDTSKWISLLKFSKEDGHEDEENLEEHDDEDEHGHNHGEWDPHVWLNPQNAIIQTNNILAWLQSMDPANSDLYQANAQQYIQKIEKLDKEIQQKFENVKFKNFIVFHNAYLYFFDHYDLSQYQKSVIQDFEWEVPSIQEIQDFIKQIDEEGVTVIFTEPQFSPKIVQMLKEERPELVIQEINPIWKILSENNYLETLELLANNIIKAMSEI